MSAAEHIACSDCIELAAATSGATVDRLYAAASAAPQSADVGVHGMSRAVPKQSGDAANGGVHTAFESYNPLHVHACA